MARIPYYNAAITWLFAALVGGIIGVHSVSCGHTNDVVKVVGVSTEVCEELAIAHNRPDIAEACKTANDVSPLIAELAYAAASAARPVESNECLIPEADAAAE